MIATQLTLFLSIYKLLQPKIRIRLPSAQASVIPPVSESRTPPEKKTPCLPLCPIFHVSFTNFPHLKFKHYQINARRFTRYNSPNRASPTRLLDQYAETVVNLLSGPLVLQMKQCKCCVNGDLTISERGGRQRTQHNRQLPHAPVLVQKRVHMRT
jgi:hypothetical protein